MEISGPEKPHPDSVQALEKMLRKRTEVTNLNLIVRYYKSSDITRSGRNMFGTSYTGLYTKDGKQVENEAMGHLKALRNIFPIYVEAQKNKSGWIVLAEVAGDKLINSKDIRKIEDKMSTKFNHAVKLFVHSKAEAMVDDTGVKPVELFKEKDGIKRFTVEKSRQK